MPDDVTPDTLTFTSEPYVVTLPYVVLAPEPAAKPPVWAPLRTTAGIVCRPEWAGEYDADFLPPPTLV